MTEISAPWDGTALGDATLAPYSSLEWAAIWRNIVQGSKANEGPIMGSGTSPEPGLTVLPTSPASAGVRVMAGSALVRGTWYNTNATVTLAIAANASGNPRIDTVILRKNYAAQTVRLVILQGATAVSPVPLALTQTDGVTWEIPLAYIAVASGFATIVAANITDVREWLGMADGVYVEDVLNASGFELHTGDPVVWDRTTDRAAKLSAVIGDVDVAGVWVGTTAWGGYGRVQVKGIGYVRCSGAVAARGLTLIPSGTPGFAVAASTAATASKRHAIGESLEITGGAGKCLAMIDVGKQRPGAFVQITTGGAGNTTSATFVDVNAADKVTITPHTDRVKVTCQFSGSIDVAGTMVFDIYSVSLTARAGDATAGLMSVTVIAASATEMFPITLVAVFTGLTPGIAQEFRLQYKSDGAKTIRAYSSVVMYAEEL